MLVKLAIALAFFGVSFSSNAFISEKINGFEKNEWYKIGTLYSSPFVSDGGTAYRGVMYINQSNKLSVGFEAYGLLTTFKSCKGKDKLFTNWIPEKVNGVDIKMNVACVLGGTTYRYVPQTFEGKKFVLKQFLNNSSVTFGHVTISSIGFNKQFDEISKIVLSYNDAL
ncbi:hypothetical protein ACSEYT_06620 [Vibrio cidicii]|uniref:hypothetical protein n=1 Tax=Vibrio cidicii TaxID=1763883 RepID=UPI003F50D9B8